MSELRNENLEETVIVARGFVPAGQRQDALRALGQFGLTTWTVEPESFTAFEQCLSDEQKPVPYTFEQITSRKQFLAREHIRSFRLLYLPEFRASMETTAFMTMVMPRQAGKNTTQKIPPEDLKLDVWERQDARFPPISKVFFSAGSDKEALNKVVRVGSAMNFIRMILDDTAKAEGLYRLGRTGWSQKAFLGGLHGVLDRQVED